jgi:hypothetical protein
MSEPGFELHPLAARDITEIWEFIVEDNAAALQQGVMVESILRILKQLHPEHTDAELAEIKRQIKAGPATVRFGYGIWLSGPILSAGASPTGSI